MEMLNWIRKLINKLINKKEREILQEKIETKEEPKLNLHKMTKGDLKKLYAQGKIKASDLKN
jgi:hypothetical protein|tara:strand:+ start:373 stop:558 length:186 start_codon:yes stop_codon:yes gene_type:complete